MNEKTFISIGEACRLTGLSQFYLRRRCKEGSLPILERANSNSPFLIHREKLLQQLREESRPVTKEGGQ